MNVEPARVRIPPGLGNALDDTSAVLLAVGGLLGKEVALEDLLKNLVDGVSRVMEADRGTIYLVDRAKGELLSKAAHLPELSEIRLKLGQGIAGFVAETGQTVNVPTSRSDARFFEGVDKETGYKTHSVLAAPLWDRNTQVIGVIQLLNKRSGHFSLEDETRLHGLAAQAALALERTTIYQDLTRPSRPDHAQPLTIEGRFNKIVGRSDKLKAASDLVRKAAVTDATVLIRGESGTGKELFARAVHVNSKRSDAQLVKVDCAALPPTLIENELFGHEAGAYTGASDRAHGKFDAAKGGTVFLDEIGELPLAVQGKLLRVLQDREYQRVGGTDTIRADVRVVAATNRNLEKMVEEQRFRADLYYRIKVVEVVLPPLRERGAEDIVDLARHFVLSAARRHGRPEATLSQAAIDKLASYGWPGNVRELENCLESAVIIMEGKTIEPDDLPLPARTSVAPATSKPGNDAPLKLEDVEKAHIEKVLDLAGGNRSQAAKLLGIGRNTLSRKLKVYGLD